MNHWRAERLEQTPPYLFVEIDRKKREAIAAGRDVIDFGVGDPDCPTPGLIVDRMAEAIRDPKNHRYPQGAGSVKFREAVATFFQRRFGVTLDPDREILTLIGSKEGLGHFPTAVVNPGETVLIPDPGYPVYAGGTIFAGGKCHYMTLHESNDWLPDLPAIPADIRRATKLMFLNYPNNPTGACAPREFFDRAVEFATEHHILIAHDAAYSEMFFDPDRPPPSILQSSGANAVAVEFHSLSKTFNMTGWRIGFAVGNADALAALAKVKNNVDSGVFMAIQDAVADVLASGAFPESQTDSIAQPPSLLRRGQGEVTNPPFRLPPRSPSAPLGKGGGKDSSLAGVIQNDAISDLRSQIDIYRRRRDILVSGLQSAGLKTRLPDATFYVWSHCPLGMDSMAAAGRLLEGANIVAIPGIGFGTGGEGYLRFALTVDESRTKEAVSRLAQVKW
ncbi:MAG: aminotransferase class I/II-fold pyridoxal phosphate-dependent enzyme [Planctomycetes bacterium]|nr:aminotransferase class I/II-fold pyridoxal phosphate-dependent enzyme [Planctomycetota bacterium]MBI3833763.1 aminotransferase class I/II-fold pyridoxal phosphate-dependent enzyme [Planctomycetota bacterium]